MLSEDLAGSYGLSVMGWLYTWFGYQHSKNLTVLLGILLFCIPLIYWKDYINFQFRLLILCSILLWVIIFNQKAESPTFIIAICGVAIWYFSQPKDNLRTTLVILAFVFTSLSPTDLFPKFLRESYVVPYVLKAVPCIFIWFYIVIQLIFRRYTTDVQELTNERVIH